MCGLLDCAWGGVCQRLRARKGCKQGAGAGQAADPGRGWPHVGGSMRSMPVMRFTTQRRPLTRPAHTLHPLYQPQEGGVAEASGRQAGGSKQQQQANGHNASTATGARLVATYRGHADCVEGVAAAPSGRRFASCGWDGKVMVWETGGRTGRAGGWVRDGQRGYAIGRETKSVSRRAGERCNDACEGFDGGAKLDTLREASGEERFVFLG